MPVHAGFCDCALTHLEVGLTAVITKEYFLIAANTSNHFAIALCQRHAGAGGICDLRCIGLTVVVKNICLLGAENTLSKLFKKNERFLLSDNTSSKLAPKLCQRQSEADDTVCDLRCIGLTAAVKKERFLCADDTLSKRFFNTAGKPMHRNSKTAPPVTA